MEKEEIIKVMEAVLLMVDGDVENLKLIEETYKAKASYIYGFLRTYK